ncbi:MAG TPA: translation initiation factor IF-2 [Candidatus Saccharimonadales bacterium]|nr:translation initiation factor IF-2 [Candidatus Saccharimonadales bacterium]
MAEKTIVLPDMITVGDLATQLDIPVTKLIGELFKNGIMATVNQTIDFDTAQIIVEELGLEVDLEQQQEEPVITSKATRELGDDAVSRPPIVAVMGHVDHGKTSLLDAILNLKVVTGEAGGITQHISAYQTEHNDRTITFLDTPGHEAFSALRQHGAALTDVVVIVVAADDGVKPQTVEAIKFAQQANAKMIVAINKIDKPAADVNHTKQQLAEHNLTPEDWGGDTVIVEVSAKTKQGIDKLLDMILLVADIEELKADVSGAAEGLVIESHMETGRGPVVSVLVEHGYLEAGQFIVAGGANGKVRTLTDFRDKPLAKAGPSTPATVTGFKELPQFGDRFTIFKSEKEARSVASDSRQAHRGSSASLSMTSTELLTRMSKSAKQQQVNLIVKADVQGSLTSVTDSLRVIENEELDIRILGSGVGNISENDVRMAASSNAVIYGFNVTLPTSVKQLAAREKVSVRIFKVIYELIDDARDMLTSLLSPEVVETQIGSLEVKGVFRIQRDMVICGGKVLSGKVVPDLLARVKRGEEAIAEAQVHSVQREQQEVKEVFEGDMCGLQLKTRGKLLLEEGDTLEFFTRETKARAL